MPPIEREHCVKGGKNVPRDQRSFSKVPGLASEAGRKGGKAAQAKLARKCNNCHFTRRQCLNARKKGAYCCCPECTHFIEERKPI